MNKTKKRAQKRAQFRSGFKYPYPLTWEYKIKNLKALRDYFGLSLSEAKVKLEDHMLAKGNSPFRPVNDSDLLI